jgi:hypothetical protein
MMADEIIGAERLQNARDLHPATHVQHAYPRHNSIYFVVSMTQKTLNKRQVSNIPTESPQNRRKDFAPSCYRVLHMIFFSIADIFHLLRLN